MQKENNHSQGNPITIGNYNLFPQELLGQGATGKVYKGEDRRSHCQVAIKHIDLKTINDDPTKILLQNQIKALKMVAHPNVIRLIQVVETAGNLYIVTELVQGGTLRQKLDEKGSLSQIQALKLFRDILAGCAAISQASIIHRDLKPSNIMLSNGNPKVIDFGFCEVIMGGGIVRAFNVGSPAYMAPEALLKTLFSEKSDSWSLGIILYEMLHGSTPDQGEDIKVFLQKVRTKPGFIADSLRADLSPKVREMLQKSLSYNTEERMSISGLKYVTDVYLIQNKNKSMQSQASPPTLPNRNQFPLTNQMVCLNQVTNPQSILRASIKTTEYKSSCTKESIGQGFMYTQLSGKQMKENSIKSKTKLNSNNLSQFVTVPQQQNFQTPSFQNFNTQPQHQSWKAQGLIGSSATKQPSGFISYDQFRKGTLINGRQSANNNVTENVSRPPFLRNDHSRIAERHQIAKLDNKNVIGDENRPQGQFVYRHVAIRYL